MVVDNGTEAHKQGQTSVSRITAISTARSIKTTHATQTTCTKPMVNVVEDANFVLTAIHKTIHNAFAIDLVPYDRTTTTATFDQLSTDVVEVVHNLNIIMSHLLEDGHSGTTQLLATIAIEGFRISTRAQADGWSRNHPSMRMVVHTNVRL